MINKRKELEKEQVLDEGQRIVRVSYTNKATIPTGIPYENQSPSYTVTQEIHFPWEVTDEQAHYEYQYQLEQMKKHIDERIKADFDTLAKFRGIESLPDWHRIDVLDEQVYPHVSEIIEPEKPHFVKFLETHAYLGIGLDKTFKDYIDHGQWIWREARDTSEINQTFDELFQLGWEWLEKYGHRIKFINHSGKVQNDKAMYVGEYDNTCLIDNILTMADVKKAKVLSNDRKEAFFMKMAAYIKALPINQPKQMAIFSPYNPPIISDDVEGYYKKFLVKRELYKNRFGI